jgi:hypothetical protein
VPQFRATGSKSCSIFLGAVAKRIQMNADTIEQREMKVRQRRSFLVSDVSPTPQTGSRTACNDDRKVIVIVKAGITHAAAVHVNRMIKKRTVAILE